MMDTQRVIHIPKFLVLFIWMLESLVGSMNLIALESQTLVLLPVDVQVHFKQVSEIGPDCLPKNGYGSKSLNYWTPCIC